MSSFSSRASSAVSPHPGYVAANWYILPVGVLAAASAAGAGTLRLVPFMLEQAVTLSDLGARVTTLAAAGNFHLGIYAADPTTKRPIGAPLAVTGTGATGLSTAAAAMVTGPLTANASLQPGFYWAALLCDNATAVFASFAVTFSGQVAHLAGSAAGAGNVLTSGTAVLALSVSGLTFASGLPDLTAASFTESATLTSPAVVAKIASVP